MKTIIRLLTVMILTLAMLGQASHAQAGGGLAFKFKGQSAVASFFEVSGCIYTDVLVIASEAKVQDVPGTPANVSFVSVTISQYDSCTDTSILYAYGSTSPLPKSAFQISKALNTGRLDTTVNVFDEVSEQTFDAHIDLAWIATGPLNREKFTTHVKTPGCVTNSHYLGKSRPAEAVGSVSDGVTNYTPGTSIQGTSLSSTKSGTVTIGCE
jgi:hypothetical protein